MIKQLTGTDEAAGRRCLSDVAQSVLFNRLSGKWSSADQAADRCLTSGGQLLINWLTGANQATDMRWSSGPQVLVNWLTGANQAADRR